MMGSSDRRRIAAAHELFARAQREGDLEAAYCGASVLACLDAESVEHRVLIETYRAGTHLPVEGSIENVSFSTCVRDSRQDDRVSTLLTVMAPALAAWQAKDLPASLVPSPPSTLDEVSGDLLPTLRRTRRALGVEMPGLCLRPEESGRTYWLNGRRKGRVQPLLIMFGEMFGELDAHELAFECGRCMTYLRPAHYAYLALDRSYRNLGSVLSAFTTRARAPSRLRAGQAAIISQIEGRLTEKRRSYLRSAFHELVASGVPLDTKTWAVGEHMTRHYAGLLMSGDLAAALRTVNSGDGFQSGPSPQETSEALLDYALSPRYLRVRKKMVVSWKTGPPRGPCEPARI